MDYTVHGILQARKLEWAAFPFSRGYSQLRDGTWDQPRDQLALQVDSLPAEPQGKPRNTGVDSLSVLQQIFLTQESNQGLLHCRWIHYQLSYQGKTKIYGLMVCTCLSVCKAAFVEYKIPLISLSFGSFETHVFWWFMIRRQSISCMVEWGLYLEVSVL